MDEKNKRLDPILSLVISIALASNGFFIKRLVDEVDKSRQCSIRQMEKISDLQEQVTVINARLRIVIKQIPPKSKPAVK